VAKIHLAQGQTAEAERTFHDLLKLRPDSLPTLKFLAEIYTRSRRGGQAIPYLEKVITLAPGDLEALYMLGSLQADAGRLAEARTAYEKFLAIEKNNGVVHNNLASVYTKLGELDRAEASARKAREFLPPATQGHAADTLGWVLFKKRQYAAALLLFQEASTKLPQLADHHYHLGLAHYSLGQGEAARPALEKALQLQPTAPWQAEARQQLTLVQLVSAVQQPEMLAALNGALEKNPDDLFALRALAASKRRAGAYAEAAGLLQRALQKQAENVALLVELAELHAYSLKALPQALEYAKAAQKFAPDDLQVVTVTGRIAYLAGEHPWAVSLLRRAGREANASLETRLHLAEAEYAVGAVPAAKEVLLQISRDPRPNLQREEVLRFLKLIDLAQAAAPDKSGSALAAAANLALVEGKPSDGSKHLEQALKSYPDFTPAGRILAGIYVWDHTLQDRAFELATKALAAAPTDATVSGILGVLNCRRGDYKKAQTQLLAGIAANREDPRLVFQLGMAELGLKNIEGARTSLTKALDMPGLPVPMQVEARDVLDNRLSMLMHEAALAK
jgi:tetratricopeptide (TPR) repeat protein